MAYTLRFPFKLPEGYRLDGWAGEHAGPMGTTWHLNEGSGDHYIVTVTGLADEQSAAEYSDRLWVGMRYLLIKGGVFAIGSPRLRRVTYAEDPELAARNLAKSFKLPYAGPVDGMANGSDTVAYPTAKSIRFAWMGTSNVIVGTSSAAALEAIWEGMEIPNSVLGQRLETALDLFGASWLERTMNARLLTLVMAVEALLPQVERHPAAIELLNRWQLELERKRAEVIDPEERDALDALERELVVRNSESIRRRFRSVASRAAEALFLADPPAVGQKAVRVYDLRSTLVHEGRVNDLALSEGVERAKEVAQIVLEAAIRNQLNGLR